MKLQNHTVVVLTARSIDVYIYIYYYTQEYILLYSLHTHTHIRAALSPDLQIMAPGPLYNITIFLYRVLIILLPNVFFIFHLESVNIYNINTYLLL